jgi:hypothetical protein
LPAILLLAECYEHEVLMVKNSAKAKEYFQKALDHPDLSCVKHIENLPNKLRARIYNTTVSPASNLHGSFFTESKIAETLTQQSAPELTLRP